MVFQGAAFVARVKDGPTVNKAVALTWRRDGAGSYRVFVLSYLKDVAFAREAQRCSGEGGGHTRPSHLEDFLNASIHTFE